MPITSYSQERLQTMGAELFAIIKEHPLYMKQVFLDKGLKAGYYSTYDQEGFVLDVDSLSLVYTSLEIDYSHNPILADKISRVCLSLDKRTFDVIFDMYNLLVSTSSLEVETDLINPPLYYFVHNYAIAACPDEFSRIVRYSRSICEAIKEKNLGLIHSLIPDIKLLNAEYKRIMRNEIREMYLPDIIIGSYSSRVFVRIQFDDIEDTDGKLYKLSNSIAKKLADYLLLITDSRVSCEIIVNSDGDWGRIEPGQIVTLHFHPQDLTYDNVVEAVNSIMNIK